MFVEGAKESVDPSITGTVNQLNSSSIGEKMVWYEPCKIIDWVNPD